MPDGMSVSECARNRNRLYWYGEKGGLHVSCYAFAEPPQDACEGSRNID